MKKGQRLTRAELGRAYTSYIESGSITAAAAAISAHPKTLQHHARAAGWPARRAAILGRAAAATDAKIEQIIASQDSGDAATWEALLRDRFTARGALALLQRLTSRPK